MNIFFWEKEYKLNLKKVTLWAGLLGLSFVSTTAAQTCDFCRMEYGKVCPYTRDREDRNKVLSYEWNISSWTDFGEFLEAEGIIQGLKEDIRRYCTYPIALAIQEVLFDNGQEYGYY